MALDFGAQIANIKMSLDKHIEDNISGVSIDYEGLPFNDKKTNFWLQPRIVDITSEFHRQSNNSGTSYGSTVNILFQTSIFVKKSGVVVSHKHWLLRDQIAGIFTIGADIPLKDYVNSNSGIASMRVRDIVNDFPMPETDTNYQYVFAVELDYLNEQTKNPELNIFITTEGGNIITTEGGNKIRVG